MPTVSEHFAGPIPGYSFSHFLRLPNGYMGPHCHAVSSAGNTNLTPRYTLIRLSRRFRIIALATTIVVLGSDANEITRLGVYAHDLDRGVPTALLADFGTILTGVAPTGARETPASGVFLDLEPGTYWIGEVTQCTGTLTTRATLSSSSSIQWIKFPLAVSASAGFFGSAQADTTLPNPATIAGTTGSVGRLLMKGIGL